MTKEIIRVRCMNLLCLGSPFRAEFDKTDPTLASLKNVICPYCGNIGAMPEHMVLKKEEIIRQISLWGSKVLYRDAFKAINYDKLPKRMEQQTVDERKQTKAPPKRTPVKGGALDGKKKT